MEIVAVTNFVLITEELLFIFSAVLNASPWRVVSVCHHRSTGPPQSMLTHHQLVGVVLPP